MYKVIWRYQVKPECVRDFLKIYDSSGEWAQLFSKSTDYIKTELFYETNAIQFFLTIDYWKSKKAFEEFYKTNKKEVALIDAMGDKLTVLEEKLGEFITK
ncbi:MAG: hypothetical protein ABJF11_19175 [Reichenbachiella sp.]|uniref:antibiotic biosynthesis monooxygenase family protein n=1 Tax=Reichenbachiella sp. TaxID=2184521 RepID=UPI0032636D0A